jgi:mannose-6-phosphate isomerase-like protein (cupin superfamily)
MSLRPGLEIYTWDQAGYQPLVFSHGWQVALLNWEPVFDLENAGEIERHNQTDEVFVLVKGRAVLFCLTPEGRMQVEDMRPNVVYNVTQGTWHNLVSTREATWIIVEDRDTHLSDTEYRQLSGGEKSYLLACLPGWAK